MKTLNLYKIVGLSLILFVVLNLSTSNVLACTPGFTWTQTANNTITFTDTTSGTTSNAHFYWNFGDQHTSTLENPVHYFTTPGTYYVCFHVIDSTVSCSGYFCDSVTVTGVNCNNLAVTIAASSASCSTCSNGSAIANVTGGTSPFNYVWSPSGGTNLTATNLLPGNYSCCITDAHGCTVCNYATVHDTIICNLTIVAYQYHYASCSNCSDAAAHSYVTGGTSPYTYLWSPSNSTSQNLTSVTPGTYTVCVTDANNCSACTTVTLIDSIVCNLTIQAYQHNPASCSSCPDGAATSGISGGTSPYTYLWSPSGQTSSSATGLLPGLYTVCVTDVHNCSTCSAVHIQGSTACTLTAGAYQHHPASCSTCGDGVAHSYASGGTSPYTYFWSPSGQTTQNATGLNPGLYTVCITDAHNCTACTTIHIGDTSSTTGCQAYFYLYPDTSQAHHYFCINYASGTAPFTYNWGWGDNTYSSGSNPSHTYANAGVYTICLQITDATGCTSHYCRTDSLVRTKNTMVYVNVLMPETGVKEIVADNQWSIYPNPTNATIILHSQVSATNSKLSIKNVLGEEIYSATLTNIDTPIDISSWSNGVYFYQIKSANNSIQGKFLKE